MRLYLSSHETKVLGRPSAGALEATRRLDIRRVCCSCDRPNDSQASPRADTLIAFLDYHRELLIDKASGPTDEQLHTRVPPSNLTLGALINHMALVEDDWFTGDFAGQPLPDPWASAPWDDDRDWEFNSAHEIPTHDLFERYRSAIARSREVIDGVEELSELSQGGTADGEAWSMRWILVHMIEETARHCGHADFIREALDGAVGDFKD